LLPLLKMRLQNRQPTVTLSNAQLRPERNKPFSSIDPAIVDLVGQVSSVVFLEALRRLWRIRSLQKRVDEAGLVRLKRRQRATTAVAA
jgi:hypothetical protein